MSDLFEYRLVPAYYDFDPSQVVHNANYLRYLEDARTAFQRTSPWPPERLYEADLVPVLTRVEIVYKAPIRLGDLVAIRLSIGKLGKSVWAVAAEFRNPETGQVYAEAGQSGCFVRKSTGRPAPMPAEFLAFCREYQARTNPPESE